MIQKLLASKLFLGAIGAVVLIGGATIYFSTRSPVSAPPIEVKRGTVVQEVVVTGKTKPAEEVGLAFERGGRVTRVGARVGTIVFAGQILASLDTSELSAELLQNQALVASEQAKLEKLKKGARPEEIKIQESKVANAEKALIEAQKSLADSIQDAFTRADNAVRNSVDQFLTNGRTSNPQINFHVSDPPLDVAIKQGRIAAENMLAIWQAAGAISADDAGANLRKIRSFLDTVSLALSALGPNPTLTQTTINGWKSDISGARTSINTAITNLTSSEEGLSSAESNLTIERNQLALDLAGSTAEEISTAEALVRQAQARVEATEAQIAKTVIRSPIAGVVTTQDAKVGEIVAANAVLVAVVSESNFEIEASVPEIEIGKLKTGNPAAITLDAFPGETFGGKIVHIDPAETVFDGVVNFKVTVIFDKPEARMKSGLTANLAIEALKKEEVLVLPQIAISEDGEGTFATKLIDGKEVRVPVVLGIRGQDGNVEIISGVNEGETVLNIGAK